MDRNERARQQFGQQQRQSQMVAQIRAALAAFAQDFAAGKAAVLDRFATVVKPHDLVLWHPPHDLVYEVTKIEPILDVVPNAPIGQIRVTLELTAPVNFLAGQPAMSMVVVGHQIDRESAELTTPTGARGDNAPVAGPEPVGDPQAAARTADDPRDATREDLDPPIDPDDPERH
jgi:hypothetical protein